jgi:hypothetical protein
MPDVLEIENLGSAINARDVDVCARVISEAAVFAKRGLPFPKRMVRPTTVSNVCPAGIGSVGWKRSAGFE